MGEYAYYVFQERIPEALQFKINQYVLNNTEQYNKAEHPEIIDSTRIFTKSSNSSVYAVDHLKYGALERYFNTSYLEKVLSMSQASFIPNIQL